VKVLKRNGNYEEFKEEKILEMLKKAVEVEPKLNLNEEDIKSVIEDLKKEIYDGISTEELNNLLVRIIAEHVSIQKPDFQELSARVLLFNLYKKIAKRRGYEINKKNFEPYNPEKFVDAIYEGVKKGIYGDYLIKEYSKEELLEFAKLIDWKRDFLFKYVGLKILIDRYLAKDGKEVYELPQEMYLLVSLTLAIPEKKEKRKEWVKKFYDLLSTHKVTVATPTLMNARRPFPQLSSCFVATVDDDLFDIYDNIQKIAMISKFAGGIGCYVGKIRAKGSKIQNYEGVCSGVIPVVRLINDTTVYVDQLGMRKGSASVTLDIWHMDILDFLEVKTTHGDERLKAHDIYPAVSIPDLFMKRLKKFLETQENQKWTLFDPYSVRHYLAKELFEKLKEKYNFKVEKISNQSFEYKLIFNSEKEAEEFEKEKDKFLALKRDKNEVFVKVKGLEDFYGEEFEKLYLKLEKEDVLKREVDLFELWKKLVGSIFEQGMPFIFFRDTVNKLNPNKHVGMIYSSNLCLELSEVMSPTLHLEEKIENDIVIRKKKPGYFPVCNLASVNLGKVNKKEDFEEVMPILVRMLDNVITFQMYAVPDAKIYNNKFRSIGIGVSNYHYLLAKNKIHWESEEHLKFANKIFELMAYYTIKGSVELAKEKGKYPLFDGSDWSKGIIFGKTKEELVEETKNNDNNLDWEGLIEEIKKYGMRNANLLALMPTGSTSLIIGTTASIDPVFDLYYKEENLSGILPRVVPEADKLAFYYKNAYLIDQTWSIRAASVRQKWIDQSQSFNLYIDPRLIDGPTLTKYYLLAWELGLKTIYYLRSKSLSDIEECESCQV